MFLSKRKLKAMVEDWHFIRFWDNPRLLTIRHEYDSSLIPVLHLTLIKMERRTRACLGMRRRGLTIESPTEYILA